MLLILLLFLVHIIAEEDEVCDAEEASETNESTQIPFIFENHLNHRVQAYWISPEDSEQHPVAGIDSGQQVEIGTYIGHRFTFRHSQTQQVLDQVTILKGMTHISLGKSELLDLGIPNVMHIPGKKSLPQQVKIWNFYDFDLAKYWLKGNEEMYSGGVEANSVSEISTYPGHTFVFRTFESKEEIARYTMEEGVYMKILGPCDSIKCREVQGFTKFQADYQLRNGVPYFGSKIRAKPQYFMHKADFLGQVHTMPTQYGYCMDTECKIIEGIELNLTVISTHPKVFYLRDVISEFERTHISELALSRLKKSLVGSGKYAGEIHSRSSKNAWLPHEIDPVVHTVCRRIFEILKLPVNELGGMTESLQFVRYLTGEEYNAHSDFDCDRDNTRFATFGIYFKTPEKGGHTYFPRAFGGKGLKVRPPDGGAVLFYNLLEDGNGDFLSLHGGMRVEKGTKYFGNLWIHEKPGHW